MNVRSTASSTSLPQTEHGSTARPRQNFGRAITPNTEPETIELPQRIPTDADDRDHEQQSEGWEVLKPIPVPEGYPALDAKPLILENKLLLTLTVFNSICLAGLCSVYFCSDSDRQYFTSDSNIRLVASWTPTIVGTITTVAARSVMFAYGRLDPYIEMADTHNDSVRSWEAFGKKSVGSQFLPPGFAQIGWALTVRNWKRLALIIYTFIMGFITSLKAVFLTIISEQGGWSIVVAPTSSKVLMLLYAINEVVLISVLIYLWGRQTGLKWDPTTIADQLSLFHGSNVLPDFSVIECNQERSWTLLRRNRYRIGYWYLTKNEETKIVYGIRRAGSCKDVAQNQANCCEEWHRPFCKCQQDYQPSRRLYDFSPVYRRYMLLFWFSLVLVALAACIVGIVKDVPKAGFRLQFSTARSQLLYAYGVRFPAVIFSSWFSTGSLPNVDLDVRFSQSFKNMYQRDASVSEALLLDYVWGLPGVVTIDALKNSHWKVAWCSLVSLLAPSFPVLVANFFSSVITREEVRFKGGEALFYTIFCFLAVYFVTLVVAWPYRNRRLPRWCPSIADLMSLFYASKVMLSSSLDISGANVVKQHLESRLFLEESRFEAGVFTGVDGTKHFGVDYKFINGEETAHVVKVEENSWKK